MAWFEASNGASVPLDRIVRLGRWKWVELSEADRILREAHSLLDAKLGSNGADRNDASRPSE